MGEKRDNHPPECKSLKILAGKPKATIVESRYAFIHWEDGEVFALYVLEDMNAYIRTYVH